MAVRVAQVDEERVRDAVAAGPALDRGGVAGRGQLVAGAQHAARLGDPDADVVQARAAAERQRDVVDAPACG